MSSQDEVRAIQKALEPWVRRIIREETASCVRRRAVTVATAPNGATIGVREPFDSAVMDVPYYATLNNARVGDTVTIEWVCGMSNAVAVSGPETGATEEEAQAMVDYASGLPKAALITALAERTGAVSGATREA